MPEQFDWYEVIGKPGKDYHIMQWDERLGSVPVAVVRDIPEELERARALCNAANRSLDLIKPGQREADDPRCLPYDPDGHW